MAQWTCEMFQHPEMVVEAYSARMAAERYVELSGIDCDGEGFALVTCRRTGSTVATVDVTVQV